MSEPDDNSTPTPPSQKPGGVPAGEPRRINFGSMTMVLLLAAVILAFFAYSSSPSNHGTTVPYSFFFQQLQKNSVRSVTFHGEVLTGSGRKSLPNGRKD